MTPVYESMIRKIMPFDLIFWWRRADADPQDLTELPPVFVQRSIETATGGGPHHVAMAYGMGPHYWHMTHPFAGVGDLRQTDLDRYDIEIGFNALLDPLPERIDVEASLRCRQFWHRLIVTKTRYDYLELLDHLEDRLGLDHVPDSDPTRFVCSTACEAAYSILGARFRPDQHVQLVDPGDMIASPRYRRRFSVGAAPERHRLNIGDFPARIAREHPGLYPEVET